MTTAQGAAWVTIAHRAAATWLRDDPTTTVANTKRIKGNANNRPPVDFTLQDLVASFLIPEVPDVAAVNTAAYEARLGQLAELEAALI